MVPTSLVVGLVLSQSFKPVLAKAPILVPIMKATFQSSLFKSKASRLLVIACCGPLLCSCNLLGLKQQVKEMRAHGAVTALVSPAPAETPPTYALAWTRTGKGELASAGFQTVGNSGLVAFSLRTNHTYGIAVFTDENGNGKYDAGELAAYVREVQPAPLGDPSAAGTVLRL